MISRKIFCKSGPRRRTVWSTVKDVVRPRSTVASQAWSTGGSDAAVLGGDDVSRLSTATAAVMETRPWTPTSGSGCPPTPRFRSVPFIAGGGVKFELLELYYRLELYELYCK